MNYKFFLIVVLSILTCCASNSSKNVDCAEFEFKNLSVDTNQWKDELSLEPINDSFYKDNISRIKELKYTNIKSLFRICDLSTENLNGYVIAQLNGPILDMYYIPKTNNKLFFIACLEVSSDEYLMKKSKLIDEKNLQMTTVHVYEEGTLTIKDSVVSYYSIEKNQFNKIKSDSIRIE